MASVFASPQLYNGGFRADQLTLLLNNKPAAGLVIQNVQFSFQQQVSTVYEIGSNNVYFVGGRAQGQATIARILGPAKAQCVLLTDYGDLCKPKNIGFTANAGCPAATPAGGVGPMPKAGCDYTLHAAVLTSISGSVTANDIVINEQLQFMYLDLQIR